MFAFLFRICSRCNMLMSPLQPWVCLFLLRHRQVTNAASTEATATVTAAVTLSGMSPVKIEFIY